MFDFRRPSRESQNTCASATLSNANFGKFFLSAHLHGAGRRYRENFKSQAIIV